MSGTSSSVNLQKNCAAQKAADFVQDGQLLGLGTGSTVRYFLEALVKRIQTEGLKVRGVPTSSGTADFAARVGIPLLDNDIPWDIDLAIDGADQVDPLCNLIKGGGGALLREKIVAKAARQFIVIVDQEKHCEHLGLPFPLPVEIVPFGWATTQRHVGALGWNSVLRQHQGQPFISDNGNFILDIHIPAMGDPAMVETTLHGLPGVVECGLFLGLTSLVITGTDQGPRVTQAPQRKTST